MHNASHPNIMHDAAMLGIMHGKTASLTVPTVFTFIDDFTLNSDNNKEI